MSELEKIISVLPLLDNSGGIDLRCYDVKSFITSQSARIAELEVAPVTVQQADDARILALISGLIASSVELRKRVTSPKRQKYLLGRIEALKDLKADILALSAKESESG